MLSDFIQKHRDELLERMLAHLRQRYPDRNDDDLLVALPGFLGELVTALLADAGAEIPGARPTTLGRTRASEHGVTRRRQGFNFDRVVHDYGLVCDVVHGLAIDKGVDLTMRELQMLNRCVDEATALACEGYLRQDVRTSSLTDTAADIHGALASASLAFSMIRKGKVALDGATANVIERNLARVGERLAQILAQAQAGALIARRDRIRVQELLASVRGEVAPDRGIVIETTVSPLLDFEGDAYLLTLALGHLLRAAIACSLPNTMVTLRAAQIEASVVLEVEDRCRNRPEQRTGAAQVALGLARRAAEAHGGNVLLRESPTGWSVAIELPRTTRLTDESLTGPGPIP